uniref:Ribose-5-phosphate isomerase n=1 Tax=Palpitomonas bilix TaxID=652834 RepID=A0A7S3CY58_9EUKA|mmetsp:Transcript_14511/g.36993  ORF Transcript_14511/g.36993 Transcript_14511/m.36993 type:complete len:154 (+) Transcript_14511:103-564(+)|eukprot:CAMPEP_0113891696 /NCGR_PEP_ID=MMETSP0780_2-20120614/14929_1 /TAXON_ID=652834 /ORGANISM="Palpitomonas bilix" /LENGTH=153 /DNA_ID=CAMNT_0000881401 /DNA_START=52 /DNA_END=513 /DNA_ORIENTATION=+ /assembly_acc=CAM_ASM_000599
MAGAVTKRVVFIGSDHGGFALKQALVEHISKKGDVDVRDLGTNSDESVHYPRYGKEVGESVLKSADSLGIVVCGTGIGISIAANKVKGVRCALCHDITTSRLCRQHNNANVLAMGGRVIGVEVAKDMVDAFLSTPFEGGRHAHRIGLIADMEE